jgi:hypothetical protein
MWCSGDKMKRKTKIYCASEEEEDAVVRGA